MAAAHRAVRPAGFLPRVGLVSTLAVAAIAGTGAWAGGLYAAPRHASGAPLSPAIVRAVVPGATQKSVLVSASPWRTGWALSLGHSGVLDGTDLTCRIVAHTSLSGSQVRFRLINYPSTTAVRFSDLVAAVRTSGLNVDPASERHVTVSGSSSVTLPPNGEVFTDPVKLAVNAGQDVTLSIAVSGGVSAPWHYWSSESSGCTPPGEGDTAAASAGDSFTARSEDRWLSEVQVIPTAPAPTFAVYGDSLTDGLYLPVDTRARWTDELESETGGRLVALNYGVAGDQITGRAPQGELPPRVMTDVLAPTGLSAVIVEMGSNDIKAGVSAQDILQEVALVADAVRRAHATLIVATVPARGDGLTSEAEQQRQLLNAGLRKYPLVADLDAALSDPATEMPRAAYDIGDHIHPNPTGVAVITAVMRAALARVPGALGAAAR